MTTKRSLIVIVALVVGFAALASGVLAAATQAVDHALLESLRHGDDPYGPVWLERAVMNLSALGSSAVVTLLVVVATLFLLLARRPRQAMLLVAITSISAIGLTLLKVGIGRERPTVVPHLEEVVGMSFPSGHTLLAAVLYPTFGMLVAANLSDRRLKIYVFAVAAALALLVGLTRVYLGVHYPSDVLGGWLLGLAFSFAAGIVIRALKEQHIIETPTGENAIDAAGAVP